MRRKGCDIPGILASGCKGTVISTIILAAGESKRMGQPKQLMSLGSTTIMEQTVDNFLSSAVDQIIVVLGYRAEELAKLIDDRPVTIAVNPDYAQGMGTSIAVGLSLINGQTQGIMLALADQPFVDSEVINQLVANFKVRDKGIVVPVYRGRRGHPVIFDIKYRGELSRINGDTGGREIINRHYDDVREVAVDCEGVCIDIDTIDTYLEKTKPGYINA